MVQSIASDQQCLCAIKAQDNSVLCWRLDTKSINEELEWCSTGRFICECDAPRDLGKVQSIHNVNEGRFCAVKSDGHLQCWDRIAEDSSIPDDLGPVRELSLGYQSGPYACAIMIDNNVKCWQEDFTKRLNYLKVPE